MKGRDPWIEKKKGELWTVAWKVEPHVSATLSRPRRHPQLHLEEKIIGKKGRQDHR